MPGRAILSKTTLQWTGLAAGPVLGLFIYLFLPQSYPDATGVAVEFSSAGRITCALGLWMATWWMTEAVPIYVTSLLPLCVLPLSGGSSAHEAAAPYAHELIFLFMGGFILALSMERWGLHKRLAFGALRLVGTQPRRVVLGFMGATAFLSMWVSNTATAIMMLPIALSVIDLVHKQACREAPGRDVASADESARNFALCMLLGVAYSASIGGVGTLIGTPPNLFLASFIESQFGREVSFVRWMAVGVPIVVIFLPVVWVLMTRVLYPVRLREIEGGRAFVLDNSRALGRMKRGEWVTLAVFSLAVFSWIFRPLLEKMNIAGAEPLGGLTDTGVAMIAAVALFVIPIDLRSRSFAMNWETAVKLPWGVLLLFGGGLSLASSIERTGVDRFIGSQVAGFAGLPGFLLVVLVTAIVIFLTELTSNTATTATFVPVLAAAAPSLGVDPYVLIVPAAIGASCAFMLPAGTPPNALVFGSGHVRIDQMVRVGFWLNLIGIVVITAICYGLVGLLFGE